MVEQLDVLWTIIDRHAVVDDSMPLEDYIEFNKRYAFRNDSISTRATRPRRVELFALNPNRSLFRLHLALCPHPDGEGGDEETLEKEAVDAAMWDWEHDTANTNGESMPWSFSSPCPFSTSPRLPSQAS